MKFVKFTKDETDYWNVGDMVLFMTIPESYGLILNKEIFNETIQYIVYFPDQNEFKVLFYHNIKYIECTDSSRNFTSIFNPKKYSRFIENRALNTQTEIKHNQLNH